MLRGLEHGHKEGEVAPGQLAKGRHGRLEGGLDQARLEGGGEGGRQHQAVKDPGRKDEPGCGEETIDAFFKEDKRF